MKKSVIVGYILVTLIILTILLLFLRGPNEYYLEGYLLDNKTGSPISGEKIYTSMEENLKFPFLIFTGGKWSKSYERVSTTDKLGYFKSTFEKGTSRIIANKGGVVHIFKNKEFLKEYEYIYPIWKEINSNITIFLSQKKEPTEYIVDKENYIYDCTNNGYYWSDYYKQCYYNYSVSEKTPIPDKSCEINTDCKKICPYGCYNINQEYDERLFWGSGSPQCEEAFCHCAPTQGCGLAMKG